eukprot:1149563-Pelagomonas_calceolata.AAC.4
MIGSVLTAYRFFFSSLGRQEQKRKNYAGRGNSTYINLGKGDTLAQKSCESPSPQSFKTESAHGDLEVCGYTEQNGHEVHMQPFWHLSGQIQLFKLIKGMLRKASFRSQLNQLAKAPHKPAADMTAPTPRQSNPDLQLKLQIGSPGLAWTAAARFRTARQ